MRRLFAAALLLGSAAVRAESCAQQDQKLIDNLKAMGATGIQLSSGCVDKPAEEKVAKLPGVDLANPRVPGNGESPSDYTNGNLAIWVNGDYVKAATLFHQGAMLGDPGCALELASLYTYGQGVKQSKALAGAWVKIAFRDNRLLTDASMRHNFLTFLDLANQGFPEAQYATGKAYAEGADGYEPSFDKLQAINWLAAASGAGHKQAAALLKEVTRPKDDGADRAWKEATRVALDNMNAQHEAFMARSREVNRGNCEAYSKGRDRPCYMP
jgi:TPR repeat protein